MKVTARALSTFLLLTSVARLDAFVVPSPSFAPPAATRLSAVSRTGGGGEFDHILGEGLSSQSTASASASSTVQANGRRRSIVKLPDTSAAATLTSSVAADPYASDPAAPSSSSGTDMFQMESDSEAGTGGLESEVAADDPFADDLLNPKLQKMLRKKEAAAQSTSTGSGFKLSNLNPWNLVKGKDSTDLILTVAIPGIIAFVGLRWTYEFASNYFGEQSGDVLEDYANEMIYHDGDFAEMKLCHDDYKKKLIWLGPKKKELMIKKYLEYYAKKKTVSPQAISSLSYVFSMYKLSEERAAQILVELAEELGTDKMSSNGKLLFFGTHILKSPEGKAALQPMKELIASTYRDSEMGDTIVDNSQKAMGEAAYKAAVQNAGKKQTSLTVGWEVLGLDRATATRIFEEVKEDGFKTDRESKYSGAYLKKKWDSKGRELDSDGKLKNPEEVEEGEDDEDDDVPTGSVFECGNCGYTLFIAEGRDFKFFGDDFKCPECGAKKDQFVDRSDDDEDDE